MIILFTGHRDKILPVEQLDMIAGLYEGATWLHGGAEGFDSQVRQYASAHDIPQEVARPDYKTYPSRQAPIIRNKQMVERCDLVVACYDGRQTGGTKFTIDYARKLGKKVRVFHPQASS